MKKSNVLFVNYELNEEQQARFDEKEQLLVEISERNMRIAKIDAQFKEENIVFSSSPVYAMIAAIGKGIQSAVSFVKKADSAITDSTLIKWGASLVIPSYFSYLQGIIEDSTVTVRLYCKEGRAMSTRVKRKEGEELTERRMTWHMQPITAIEIGEHMGGETGELVCVDLRINFLSDFDLTFNKLGDSSFKLFGDLIKIAKRNAKYVQNIQFEQTKAVAAVTNLIEVHSTVEV